MAIEGAPSRSKRIQPQMLFSWALVGATTLPFISFATNLASAVPALMFLFMLGGTHIVATAYLFNDPAIRRFCPVHPIKMIIVPSVILIAALAVFSRPNPLFTVATLVLFLFQAWHFGAQNIGVASFISLSERGRPLAPFEKTLIKVGIWVGILGVLKAMSPDFGIGASYVQLPAEAAAAIGSFYEIGKVLAFNDGRRSALARHNRLAQGARGVRSCDFPQRDLSFSDVSDGQLFHRIHIFRYSSRPAILGLPSGP
jgi:hypothetical protein